MYTEFTIAVQSHPDELAPIADQKKFFIPKEEEENYK